MIWDSLATRYGCLPRVIDTLSPSEFLAGRDGLIEDYRQQLRVAVFPVWLTNGKKGEPFPKLLKKLGLQENGGPTPKSKKLSKGRLDELKANAERIKKLDLKRG